MSLADNNLLLENLQVREIDENFLNEALTHPSYNNENNYENAPDYERLEFLGDSVLRLAVSHYLFDKYKDFPEGKLTKIRSYLVSDEFLAKIANKIELNRCLNIGKHEEKDGGRNKESILACAMEAVLGAIYKSSGYDIVKECIYKIYNDINVNISDVLYFYESKEILQKYTQGLNKDLPEYKLISESGPAHNRIYEVVVMYHGEELGRGVSLTKKDAEKNAALNALKKLNITEENYD